MIDIILKVMQTYNAIWQIMICTHHKYLKPHNKSCGVQMIYGPGPSIRGESKGPSRGGLWPKLDKIAFEYRRG